MKKYRESDFEYHTLFIFHSFHPIKMLTAEKISKRDKNIVDSIPEKANFRIDVSIILPINVMNLYVRSFEALFSPNTSIKAGPKRVKIALSVNPKKIIESMKVILLLAKEENIFTAISMKQ